MTSVPRSARPSSGGFSHPALVIPGLLICAVLLGLVLWWLNSPEASPPLEGSYINSTHHFAMLAAADWTLLTQENYGALFDKLGDRFPKMLREGLASRRVVVGFMKLLETAEFSPSVNVVVIETNVPELDEEQLAEGGRVLGENFSRILDNYRLERSELVTLDELTCAQFTNTGSIRLKVDKPAEPPDPYSSDRSSGSGPTTQWKDFELKFVQTLVPGKGRAYILTASALVSQFPEYQKDFDALLSSFRVLQRPSRFGSIVMGALNGGVGSALAYLLFAMVMKIVGMFRRQEVSEAPLSL